MSKTITVFKVYVDYWRKEVKMASSLALDAGGKTLRLATRSDSWGFRKVVNRDSVFTTKAAAAEAFCASMRERIERLKAEIPECEQCLKAAENLPADEHP